MINQKTIKIFIYIFIIFYSINYIFFTYRFFSRENGFILGDWLINYSGGLARRGLSGEMLIKFANFFNLDLINTTFIFVSIIFVLFVYYLVKLIHNSNISFLIALIIFSPATILFNFFDPLAIGRKEIIFFLFLLIYFELREKLYFNTLLIPISLFAMFTHELFFLLIPFFFISRYLMNTEFKIKNFSIEIFILVLSILYFLVIKFIFEPDVNKMCLAVLEFGLNDKVCWAISTNNDSMYISHFIKDAFYTKYYSIFFILISFPIYLFLRKYFSNNHLFSILLIVVTIFPFFSLFIMVNDWGRYLNVFAMYWMIILLQISKKNIVEFKFKKYYLIIIFLFSSTWYMPHCCPEIHFKDKIYNPSIKYFIERIYYRLQT